MRVGARQYHRFLVVAAAWAPSTVPLFAHGEEAHTWNAPGPWSVWDLAAMTLLAITGTLYATGSRRLSRRSANQPRRERISFACGWVILLVSILPPLDALATQLFSAHMVQHELMMLAGAPLIIAGRPLSACLWGLPGWLRPAAISTLQSRAPGGAWRWLTAPAVAWVLHGAAIWVWHVPALYDAAVQNEAIHALQHATFVGTSALFWWGLLYGRYGRAGYGAAVFYVFTTVVHTGLLGAMLTFAGVPLYTVYLAPAVARGLDPLSDQHVAGLVMWIPAGVVLSLLGIALFAAWIGEAERRAGAPRRNGATRSV